MTDGNRENLADEFKDLYVFHPVSPKMIVSNKTNGIQNPINIDLHIPLVQPRIQPRKPKVLAGVNVSNRNTREKRINALDIERNPKIPRKIVSHRC